MLFGQSLNLVTVCRILCCCIPLSLGCHFYSFPEHFSVQQTHGQIDRQIISYNIVLTVLVGDISALTCKGKPHLIQGYAVGCKTDRAPNPDIENLSSCAYVERMQSDVSDTCSSGDCTVNSFNPIAIRPFSTNL